MSRCSCARRSSRWRRRFSAWRASRVGATWPAGRALNCCFQPFEALLVDPKLSGDLATRQATDQPVLDGLALKGFVIPLVFGLGRVAHACAAQLTHSPTTCPPNRWQGQNGIDFILMILIMCQVEFDRRLIRLPFVVMLCKFYLSEIGQDVLLDYLLL